jgi:glucans biosynthesis protein C
MPSTFRWEAPETDRFGIVEADSAFQEAPPATPVADLRNRLTVGMRSAHAVIRMKPEAVPDGGRDYALDAARAVLMMLGIALHSAAAYSVNGEWVVHDTQNSSVVFDWLLEAVHLFRMPAFFWISGYFFALTMTRGDHNVVLGKRLFRILVPALVTWATFNVVQEAVMAVHNHKDPVQALLTGGVPAYHLWFLFDLAILTCVVALVFVLPAPLVEKAAWKVPRSFSVPGILLVLTLLSFGTIGLARLTGVAYVRLGHLTTISRLANYLPYVIAGAAMYHLAPARRAFLRVPLWLGLVALPLGVYFQGFRRVRGFEAELAAPAEQLTIWICIAVVLQLFYRAVHRESRAVSTLSDASYSVYLFHHAIMVGLVLLLLPLPLGAFPKFVICCVIALVVSAALHLYVVRRSPLLLLLFNGKWARRKEQRIAA